MVLLLMGSETKGYDQEHIFSTAPIRKLESLTEDFTEPCSYFLFASPENQTWMTFPVNALLLIKMLRMHSIPPWNDLWK